MVYSSSAALPASFSFRPRCRTYAYEWSNSTGLFKVLWGVVGTAGRTGSFLHWGLSKGFLSQTTQESSAPVNDKTSCRSSERLFSQTYEEPRK